MENFLDTYYNHNALSEDLDELWNGIKEQLQRGYDEWGKEQPFAYLLAMLCSYFVGLFYSVLIICENIVIGKKSNAIYNKEKADEARVREILGRKEGCSPEVFKIPESKTKKEDALILLRDKLRKENWKLTGTILHSEFNPRISSEDLLLLSQNEQIGKPYITERVTFGNEINTLLKIINPNIKHRKLRGSSDTYIVFNDNERFDLAKELKEIFMKEVKIDLKVLRK